MPLHKLVIEELQNKLDICNDEIGMASDDAFYLPRAESVARVLVAGTLDALRSEPLAMGELANAYDILSDNIDSVDGDDLKSLRRTLAPIRRALGY